MKKPGYLVWLLLYSIPYIWLAVKVRNGEFAEPLAFLLVMMFVQTAWRERPR
jgi:hypothetical protein